MQPHVDINILDGALGIIAPDVTAASAKLGVSTAGVIGQLYSYQGSDTTQLKADLGEGPLVENIAQHLATSGGKPVHAMKLTASVAGTNGAITKGNGGAPTVTVAGAPNDRYDAIIRVTATGALGVGQAQESLDGGDNWGQVFTIPAGGTRLIPGTNMTNTYPAGTYTVGDTFSWTTTAPGFSNGDLAAGFDSLMANPTTYGFIHLVGTGADAAATLTMATTLQSKLAAAASTLKRFMFAVMEMPAVDKALILTAFADAAMDRVYPAGGYLEQLSYVRSGRIYKRPFGWAYASAIARVPISVDPSRLASDADLYSLADAGVVKLVPAGAAASTGYHDETNTPGFEGGRMAYAMTIPGRPGFYIGNANGLAAPGSDFKWVQYRRIMDRACDIASLAGTRYMSKRIFPSTTTGFIKKSDASAIERDITAKLKAGLVEPGHVPEGGATCVVNKADNLLSSPIVRIKLRIVPPGYGKAIEIEIGFYNPALAQAA